VLYGGYGKKKGDNFYTAGGTGETFLKGEEK
jgi:hypothetical protein